MSRTSIERSVRKALEALDSMTGEEHRLPSAVLKALDDLREFANGSALPENESAQGKYLPHVRRNAVRSMLEMIGDDPSREGLHETPDRVVKAWDEWFAGYKINVDELFKVFEDGAPGASNDQLVLETNIPVFSWCEHHMAPIVGVAHVAYIPSDSVVGLSKLARVVDAFARRLQVQERLTNDIVDAIDRNLKPAGCGVVITAEHFCMCTRGVKLTGVKTTTSALRGALLKEPEARAEFFSLIAMTK